MANFCKYYKEVKQVSYDSGQTWENLDVYRVGELYESDSPDCGGGTTQYKWVNVSGEYTCVGTTKYQKTKKQQSTDGGQTWTDVSPIEYGTGAVIEYNSSDCSQSYSGQYLTFVALENGTFKFSGTSGNNSIQYSLDNGSTWNTLASGANSPTVTSGNKIMWKGNLVPAPSETLGIGTFSSTKGFTVEGNAHSLLWGDNFQNQTSLSGKDFAFAFLFSGCTRLTSAENLILSATTLARSCYRGMFYGCTSLTSLPSLPATTLAYDCYGLMFLGCTSLTTVPTNYLPAMTLTERCYESMFDSCTKLTTAPTVLPATTLADCCYQGMFQACSNLVTAPQLPATTLATQCYCYMFSRCTSLTVAPELPATTLAAYCYDWMFRFCSSLNYVKCLATNISATNCTRDWLLDVSSSGTFVKASSMSSWSRGTSGIPNNWSIQNA